MEEIKGNSHKSRDGDRPKLQPIVTTPIRRRKPNLGRRFLDNFTSMDAKSVFAYVLTDVLLPSAKETVADMVRDGVEWWLWGDGHAARRGRGRGRRGRPGSGDYSYDQVTRGPSRRDRDERPRRRRRSEIEDVVIDSRVEAEEVLRMMYEILNRYDVVRVAEVYDLLHVTPDNSDYKWGWEDLEGSRVSRARGGGYCLDLPTARPVED